MDSRKNIEVNSIKRCQRRLIRSRGFTLIEFLAVMSLVLILSLITFHAGYLSGVRTDTLVHTMASDIRYVNQMAKYAPGATFLIYDIAPDQEAESIRGYSIREDDAITKDVRFPVSFQVKTQNQMRFLRFDRNGHFIGRGETIFCQDSLGGNRYRITIVPFSGRVEVYRDE